MKQVWLGSVQGLLVGVNDRLFYRNLRIFDIKNSQNNVIQNGKFL